MAKFNLLAEKWATWCLESSKTKGDIKEAIFNALEEFNTKDTKGRTEIIKITEAALEGDKEKAKKFIERYMIKYPESDLIYPFRNLLNNNKNPNGLTK